MVPNNFTTVDIIAAVFILIGAAQGLIRGLSGEMARLLGAICAFVAGALLHEPVGEWIASHTRLVDQEAQILTYIVTVVAALILWALFHKLIKQLLQLVLSKGFDKIAGIPAGMLRMTALVGIVCIAIHIWPQAPFKEHVGPESFFGRHAIRLIPSVQRKLEAHNLNLPGEPATQPSQQGEPHPEKERQP